jgi:hypothetical protein
VDQYVKFRVKRTANRKPNTAQIQLYNLGPDSLEYLKTPGQVAVLLAGDDYPASMFTGDIGKRGVITKRNGPNLITTLKVGDGRRVYREAWFSKSFPGGTDRDIMIQQVIAEMGIPIGSLGTVAPYTFAGPKAFNAPAREVLTELLEIDQSAWMIQDGAIYLFALGETLPGNAILVSTETGLMGSPEVTDKGINFKVRLNPVIRERSLIQLRSEEVTMALRVATVDQSGDTFARSWETKVQAKPV